jgi:signal transduction histidine kinase/CheY-like chemotaxis protein/HPt (histidine-containing phosphotransfer) domain-containing protein
MRADGSLDRVLTDEDGLPVRMVNSLFVDAANGLWATSGSAVFRVDESATTALFDKRAKLPEQPYRTITKFGDRLLVGCETGVYALSADGRAFVPVECLSGYMHEIRATPTGLLVGTFGGAKLFDGTKTEIFHKTSADVLAVAPSRRSPGSVYLADNFNVVVQHGAESRVAVQELADSARSFAEDDAGKLWIGTIAQGVFVAQLAPDKPVKAEPAGTAFGLPPLEGRSFVRATQDGAIVIFADNGGWIKPAATERFHTIANYPARGIGAASDFAADNTLWVAHTGSDGFTPCVARIAVHGSEAQWQPHSIPGLATIGAPRSLYVDTDKAPGDSAPARPVLWIGGTKSVLRHVVTNGPLAPKPHAPILHVLARTAEGQVQRVTQKPLPYSTRSVMFEFAAPEFGRRDQLRLETRIDGIDHDWVRASPDSRRELTALRDASYTFRVRAVAETGVASDPAVFAFQVLPPWWRTPLAVVLASVALVPLGYGAYHLRVRTLRRRNADLERKVHERTEELELANAAKTQFVANMSHDIRNPLNGIVGMALALEDTTLDPRQREIVATLRECTTYLSSLVDDVLDFASIEAGRVELRPGPFAPPELLRSIVETLKADTAESGSSLAVECGDTVPANLLGDAGRIQQILVNFVSNALKYAGGHIRLVASVPPNAPGEIEFSVIDEGPGISEADQAVLFAKFSRLKQKHGEDAIPGTGLGLAACRSLADIMGGSVGVESRIGHGARFFLRLPLTIATQPVEAPNTELPNTTVLLVEDTDYNAWAASAVLAKLGLSCERARNGREALELFGRKQFNVVLLDRNLPDIDGTEVARRMREMETEGFHAVLLAITAYCTAEDRQLCLKSGMDAFVGKPLTPDKLRKALLAASRQLQAGGSVHVPHESTVAPHLDLSLLSYLSDGSPTGLETQIARFLNALDEAHAPLAEACRNRDFTQLAALAHRVRGQAKMIGANALSDTTARLEAAAQAADESACRELCARVDEEIHALKEAVRHHRSAVPST